MHTFRYLVCIAAFVLASTTALAAYPDRPVRIVVPFAAGSGSDNVARYYAMQLGKELKQTFFVENKPGANGSIGAALVAKSPADGYTLLLGSNSTLSAAPFLFKKLPYDPIKDFASIARLSDIPQVLAVAANSPLRTFEDFIREARAKPNSMTWAHANTAHLAAGMALTKQAGLEMVPVPYKSSPQALLDLISGQVRSQIVDTSASYGFIQQGKIRALAVTTMKPIQALPSVPPISETFPGVDVYSWLGIVGPAGMPEEAIKMINTAVLQINAREETQRFLLENAAAELPPAESPEEFSAFMKNQLHVWEKLLKDANIQPE